MLQNLDNLTKSKKCHNIQINARNSGKMNWKNDTKSRKMLENLEKCYKSLKKCQKIQKNTKSKKTQENFEKCLTF